MALFSGIGTAVTRSHRKELLFLIQNLYSATQDTASERHSAVRGWPVSLLGPARGMPRRFPLRTVLVGLHYPFFGVSLWPLFPQESSYISFAGFVLYTFITFIIFNGWLERRAVDSCGKSNS